MSNEEFITESELGEKQYWNNFYENELNNFCDVIDLETSYGFHNAQKIIIWINQNIDKNGLILNDKLN